MSTMLYLNDKYINDLSEIRQLFAGRVDSDLRQEILSYFQDGILTSWLEDNGDECHEISKKLEAIDISLSNTEQWNALKSIFLDSNIDYAEEIPLLNFLDYCTLVSVEMRTQGKSQWTDITTWERFNWRKPITQVVIYLRFGIKIVNPENDSLNLSLQVLDNGNTQPESKTLSLNAEKNKVVYLEYIAQYNNSESISFACNNALIWNIKCSHATEKYRSSRERIKEYIYSEDAESPSVYNEDHSSHTVKKMDPSCKKYSLCSVEIQTTNNRHWINITKWKRFYWKDANINKTLKFDIEVSNPKSDTINLLLQMHNSKGDTGISKTVFLNTGKIGVISVEYDIQYDDYTKFVLLCEGNIIWSINCSEGIDFSVKGVYFEMMPVVGGTFMMGATKSQGNNTLDCEKPVHKVTLSNYLIGRTHVTQALWKAVMGNNPSVIQGDELPVCNVCWHDCQRFILKLNELTGGSFRLPTEAEWEFAARGGNKSCGYKFSGSNKIDDVCWTHINTDGTIKPVATKQPNELGIYDMSGNVGEWCFDRYGFYSNASQTNPKGIQKGTYRVVRGLSWYKDQNMCRISFRKGRDPGDKLSKIGFRLACDKKVIQDPFAI